MLHFLKLHCFEISCNKNWQEGHKIRSEIGGIKTLLSPRIVPLSVVPEIKSNPNFISSSLRLLAWFLTMETKELVNTIFNSKATVLESKHKASPNYRPIEYTTKTKSRQFISFANPINFVFINMIILIKAEINFPYLSAFFCRVTVRCCFA